LESKVLLVERIKVNPEAKRNEGATRPLMKFNSPNHGASL
jgi:hypothetical protein